MNKAELVAAMAEKAELSKKDAEAALKGQREGFKGSYRCCCRRIKKR